MNVKVGDTVEILPVPTITSMFGDLTKSVYVPGKKVRILNITDGRYYFGTEYWLKADEFKLVSRPRMVKSGGNV